MQAVITFIGSTDDALDHYELHGIPGPGMAAFFKGYVVLTTGNEAGSGAVSVERPA